MLVCQDSAILLLMFFRSKFKLMQNDYNVALLHVELFSSSSGSVETFKFNWKITFVCRMFKYYYKYDYNYYIYNHICLCDAYYRCNYNYVTRYLLDVLHWGILSVVRGLTCLRFRGSLGPRVHLSGFHP